MTWVVQCFTGHGRNLGAAGASEVVSGSLLQGRARPIVIGGRVVGEPLAEQQQQQQNTRRSARAQSRCVAFGILLSWTVPVTAQGVAANV